MLLSYWGLVQSRRCAYAFFDSEFYAMVRLRCAVQENYPIDSEEAHKHLEICSWLVEHGGTDEDRGVLNYVCSEVLFQRALGSASEEEMRCALCYAEKSQNDRSSPVRARERLLYLQHFAAHHFAGLSTEPHRCIEVKSSKAFPLATLLEKMSQVFSWNMFIDKKTQFTL